VSRCKWWSELGDAREICEGGTLAGHPPARPAVTAQNVYAVAQGSVREIRRPFPRAMGPPESITKGALQVGRTVGPIANGAFLRGEIELRSPGCPNLCATRCGKFPISPRAKSASLPR